MRGLILGNVDYEQHMTTEGKELQDGLVSAGWQIAGVGFGDGQADVPTLIERHGPTVVFVQDKRDWDPASQISFRKDVGFGRLGRLRNYPDVVRVCVVKDAGSSGEYHRNFCREIGANAVAVYYHPRAVRRLNEWLDGVPLVRTWHSVDADLLRSIDMTVPRKRCLVSGASGQCYPLRRTAIRSHEVVGCDVLRHPGYGNSGPRTPDYLRTLAGYKVHVATASTYAFALRKIIESVACCCTPVTDLPDFDVLPEIDGALARVSPYATAGELRDAVDRAERSWSLEDRMRWAVAAWSWYDWRNMGRRLSDRLSLLRSGPSPLVPCVPPERVVPEPVWEVPRPVPPGQTYRRVRRVKPERMDRGQA